MKRIAISLLSLLLISALGLAQTGQQKRLRADAGNGSLTADANPEAAQRRDLAIAMVISLAKEASSFDDLALRPRVLARAADILWDADNANARALFQRAWETAEKGDAEEVSIKTKDNPPPMVIGLRRLSGHDLRSEVLALVARRDRHLAREFLARLKNETERQAANSNHTRPLDNWSTSEAEAKTLEVARRLLSEGLVEQALEIASPALNHVNSKSITFLSELRVSNAEAADQRFSILLNRTNLNPYADANTVSGLSSYVFTPGFYITFKPEGGLISSQSDRTLSPPNLPVNLRNQFFQVGANILLRRLPPPDQDFSSAGRSGTINVIRRLLPLFEQYVPDTATALRAHLTQLTGNPSSDPSRNDNPYLNEGIRQPETGDVFEGLPHQIIQAKTSRERDEIYATAAITLASKGDTQAHDLANKIDDAQRKLQVRQFIDLLFLQLAIKKKDAAESLRLAETGQLTHTQRAYAYTQAARLVRESQPDRSLELLEKATEETMRIEIGVVDRALLLVGIAVQLTATDQARVWGTMSRAAKAANECENFHGENRIHFSMVLRNGVKSIGIGGEEFSLNRVFQLLAKDDFYRAIDLTKSFKHEAPRAASILAIASEILNETRSLADAR